MLLGVVLLAAVLVLLSGWRATSVRVTDAPASTPAVGVTPTSATPTTDTPAPTEPPTTEPPSTPVPSPSPTPVRFAGVPDFAAPLGPVEAARLQRPADARPERPALFEGWMLVGLYGTPGGRGLGILGTTSPTATVALVQEQAAAYQALLTDTAVVPYFHMVTTIADPFPGRDHDYSHRVSTPTIQTWLDVAGAHGVMSVLDIQPGHSPITEELAYVAPFLAQRGVHLAVDPEFVMSDTADIPGHRIGVMTGEAVNLVQAWLSEVAQAAGERKLLVIHQFENRMFDGKDVIEDYPLVELVWDADGFGGPGSKIADYVQYAQEPGFEHGGFKLFYNYDDPLMAPEDVLRLLPRPVLVVYQ
jgi:hypothetical protein